MSQSAVCVIFALMDNRAYTPKGRNQMLISGRNKKLAARFYWYSMLIGLKFERCLNHLSEEFDLSTNRISTLITENADYISELDYTDITEAELQQRYPFFSWQYLPSRKFRNGGSEFLSLSGSVDPLLPEN